MIKFHLFSNQFKPRYYFERFDKFIWIGIGRSEIKITWS